MKLVEYARVRTQSAALEAVQDNLQKYIRQLQANPTLDNRLITGVTITAGTPKVITHNLGRIPQGWNVCDITAASSVFRTAWTETTITLDASVNCTIAVLVW